MLHSIARSAAAASLLLFGAAIALADGGHGVYPPKDYHAYSGPGGCRTGSTGACQYRFYGQPDLFYNYWVPPTCGGVGAELYLSPRPVPAWVGHTYVTYQPLMPHELMYDHHRTYHRYYNGGQGLTRTSVRWW